MIYLIAGLVLTYLSWKGIVWLRRKDANSDLADKLVDLDVLDEELDLREQIADKKGELNKKRKKVVKQETKVEK